MQVNSITPVSVQSKSSFGNRDFSRQILEEFANADDKALKQAALQKASIDVNDKKHRRISNVLYYSFAPAIGLAAMIEKPAEAVSKLAKISTSRSLRLKNFAGNTIGAAIALLGVDLVMRGVAKLENSSDKIRKFTKDHPVMSFLATAGTGIGALTLLGAGALKLQNLVKSKPVKFATKKLAYQINNKLNNSKILNKASELLTKVPSAIKGFAKGAAAWAPLLLVLANINHSFNHAKAKTVETAKNYTQLKEAQTQVRMALANEVEE